MGDWIHINDINSLDGINAVYCDTRDFHCCLIKDQIDLYSQENRSVSRKNYDHHYQIAETEVITWLKNLEALSGGRGEWRFLNFRHVDTDGWLKYIRFYRNVPRNPGYFIVCNGSSEPICWELCTEENLEKEHIDFEK